MQKCRKASHHAVHRQLRFKAQLLFDFDEESNFEGGIGTSMQQHDVSISRLTEVLGRLTNREIALLVLSIRKDPMAYPPAASTTVLILELARKEVQLRQ